MSGTVAGIIVAAGDGKRLGAGMPKAFVDLGGHPLFTYSLRVFATHRAIRDVIVVVGAGMIEQAAGHAARACPSRAFEVVPGGVHRWQSVYNGVSGTTADWVLVHDAARPFVTGDAIDALLAKRDTYQCAIVATPVVDTVRTYEGDRCSGTIDRSTLVRVGTPQLFHRTTLLEAFGKAEAMSSAPTDEAMLMESCGVEVGLAWGDPGNFKITTQHDLAVARALIAGT
ncbi:MAG: 2-C-methyl-D-erythritol 4-phosphate cytidylyltransferase [Chitinivibrionales bacterium]|nr:2-C-methyl-D-erythritol 4-phosphate cytidylyltransferase [Chitinivibrionales bacterium]MBD3397078.1 2-C-methyl-D-erythritol 4-phosphate cytidylyltransferase [Chitinivibrionales bacterium]